MFRREINIEGDEYRRYVDPVKRELIRSWPKFYIYSLSLSLPSSLSLPFPLFFFCSLFVVFDSVVTHDASFMKPNETARSVPGAFPRSSTCLHTGVQNSTDERGSVPRDLSPNPYIVNWLSFLREFNGIAGNASLLVLSSRSVFREIFSS